jgi:hypothetical protein
MGNRQFPATGYREDTMRGEPNQDWPDADDHLGVSHMNGRKDLRIVLAVPAASACRRLSRIALVGILMVFSLSSQVRAAVFEVPSFATPTLEGAVAAALVAGNETHYIYLTASPVFTNAQLIIGPAPVGSPLWRLIIRPAPCRLRATITSSNGSQPIFMIGANARDIDFQDLDIIRHATNNADLIVISDGTRITFDERKD